MTTQNKGRVVCRSAADGLLPAGDLPGETVSVLPDLVCTLHSPVHFAGKQVSSVTLRAPTRTDLKELSAEIFVFYRDAEGAIIRRSNFLAIEAWLERLADLPIRQLRRLPIADGATLFVALGVHLRRAEHLILKG